MKRSKYFQEGLDASAGGLLHARNNPYPEASKPALQWFDGFMEGTHRQKIHLKFRGKVVEGGKEPLGLLTIEHFVGIANYDGNLVKVFDLKIQEKPQRYSYRKRLPAKLITTVKFWDVGGGSQGSGTAENLKDQRNAHFIAVVHAMWAAGVICDIGTEVIQSEEALFKELFPAVGELIRVPDRIYNFEVFKVV